MSFFSNPFNPSVSLPTQNAIDRRRRELLGSQANAPATQSAANPTTCLETEPLDQFKTEDEVENETQDPLGEAHISPTSPQTALSLNQEALHGIAGQAVRALAPCTEADPAAILLQFLAAFGNIIGRSPHCRVGPARHSLNLFLVLVGESSKARKGTSWRQVSNLFDDVDPEWTAHCIYSARPTAANILNTFATRDNDDRRLFLLAEEFVSVLQILIREISQLSPLLRGAWDGGDLAAHNGHRGLHISGAHFSLIGHITQGELAPLLGRAESHNGFANRCLWAAVRRSCLLPEVPRSSSRSQARHHRGAATQSQPCGSPKMN
jgi:hypothetical protein